MPETALSPARSAPRPPPAAGVSASDPQAVAFRNVGVSYGDFVAVRNFSLDIPKGSFVTLLGPSGCGKTTVLRSIAGLVAISEGQIAISGRRVDDIPIYKRDIGMVFQNYALFPHKTVFDNVAFGLKYRSVPKPEIASRVRAALEMVRLPGAEKKLPSQLSGGQQQRIALARAIVFEPQVLLMDEPLSALDANMREDMRLEIKKIQKATGITAIFVTHDQDEALSMSDRIVVMNAGSIEQIGTPQEVYEHPASRFVAGFLGKANMLPGRLTKVEGGLADVTLMGGAVVKVAAPASLRPIEEVTLVIRPQKLRFGAGSTNTLTGSVVSASYLGINAIYELDVDGARLRINTVVDGQLLPEGASVQLGFEPSSCILLHNDGLRVD